MKKLKLSMIFAAVALLAIGCSNLWDYDPPKTNTPPPPTTTNPPDTTPPIGSNKLTFWVFDGNGIKQKIEISVSSGTEKVTAAEIKKAIKEKYPQLLEEENLPEGREFEESDDGFVLYESDLSTLADGSYEDGAVLVIGVKTKYTSSITTPDGGKVVYLTDSDFKTAGEQTLSDILTAAGITNPSNPGTAPDGWTFKGWEKVGQPDNTPIDPSTYGTVTYPSGTSFVAVYDVPYKINIGGTDYTVTVPVTAPNEGATWEQILDAAKAAIGGDPSKLDDLIWKDEDGDEPSTDSKKQYPAGTSFTGYEELTFNVNGQEVKVPVEAGKTTATWAEIKTAAIAEYGEDAINSPAVPSALTGGVFAEWRKDGESAAASGDYAPGASFYPAFNVFYTIYDYDGVKSNPYKSTHTVTKDTNYALPQNTVKTIFTDVNAANSNKVPSDGSTIKTKELSLTERLAFDGWKVIVPGSTEPTIVRSSEIAAMADKFPAGTEIKPNGIFQLFVDHGWDEDGVGMEFTWFEGSNGIEFKADGGETVFTKIGDFYIANTEITRKQWKLIMSYKGLGTASNGTSTTGKLDEVADGTWLQMEGGAQWNHNISWGDDFAMDYISWYDAIMLCNQLSRLNGRDPYYYLEVTATTNGVEPGVYKGDDFFRVLNDTGILKSPGNIAAGKPANSGDKYYNELWDKVEIKIDESLTDKPGFRLPTSEYWMYAAHGGEKVVRDGKEEWLYPKYSGTTGTDEAALVSVGWFDESKAEEPKTGKNESTGYSGGHAHPVATKGGNNPIRDMTGNVSEWCWDEYDKRTRLYIGGTYDAPEASMRIYAALMPGKEGGAMFGNGDKGATEVHERWHAGQPGTRNTQGMRIIVPGRPGDYADLDF